MNNDVIPFYRPGLSLNFKELLEALELDAPRAVDYALSAERQLWAIVAKSSNDAKVYELALMVASGNLDDSIRLLKMIRDRIDDALLQVRDK